MRKSKGKIEIIIETDGSAKIEGHDFEGGACEKATSFLEKALGLIKKKKRKPERWKLQRAGSVSAKQGL